MERAKKGEDRQFLVDVILPVLADPSIPDEQVGGILRGKIGMSRLREVMAGPWKPLPKDHGRLSVLDASYSYLRQFTPNVLATIAWRRDQTSPPRRIRVRAHRGRGADRNRRLQLGCAATVESASADRELITGAWKRAGGGGLADLRSRPPPECGRDGRARTWDTTRRLAPAP